MYDNLYKSKKHNIILTIINIILFNIYIIPASMVINKGKCNYDNTAYMLSSYSPVLSISYK